MMICIDCKKTVDDVATLPNADRSATVQCLECHAAAHAVDGSTCWACSPAKPARITENDKRRVVCVKCLASIGKPCRGSRQPGANTFGGGWGGPPDLERSHDERRKSAIAFIASLSKR